MYILPVISSSMKSINRIENLQFLTADTRLNANLLEIKQRPEIRHKNRDTHIM